MNLLFDAFWRAVAYCLHPRVILLSILPLIAVGGLATLLGYLYWSSAVTTLQATLTSLGWFASVSRWLDSAGAGWLASGFAPLMIVALAVPLVVVLSLLLVAVLMTPALVKLVAARRFPQLEQRHGAGFWQSAMTSLGCTLAALLALVVSIPLWFVPPLVLIVPPLIWGWLTYRVMTFDVLAEHASSDERRTILRQHRWSLLGIGIVTGYLGAAPSLVWAFGALTLVFAPLLLIVAVWLYTLVFAFSALWFAHYALAALQALRQGRIGSDGRTGASAAVPLRTAPPVIVGPIPPRLPVSNPATPP
ncbi:MAG: EI24 domain-containing protein [Caldimonas sp.]